MSLRPAVPPATPARFQWSLWGVAIWVALLWSAYIEHIFIQQLPMVGPRSPAIWLGLLGNAAVIVICLAAVLRIHWARPALRLAALLVALWIPFSARQEWQIWRQISAPVPAGTAPALAAMQASMQQQLHWLLGMDLAMKLVLLLFWLWLCWRLGRADVAPQFDRRLKPRRRG